MATTIITKNGSGAPAAGDLVQGELAVDLTNQTLYSKDSSGNVFKVGDTGGGSPGTFTDLVATDSFTSPGIDDNATSTAITIDSSEDVGIGTNNPANNGLTIEKSGTARLRLAESGVRSWDIEATGGDWRLNNATNSKEVLRIDPTGNVGIGTATPSTSLTKTGITAGLTAEGTVPGFCIQAASGANNAGYWFQQNGMMVLQNYGPGSTVFRTGTSGSETVRIDATGNVGIDSTAPARNLTIGGTTADTTHLQLTNATSGTTTGDGFQISQYTSGAVQLWNKENSYMAFGTNNAERMRIDASGTTTVTGGFEAAQPGAGTGAFAAGDRSGDTSQGTYTVAIGYAAGETSQGDYSVASGFAAGQATQGSFAVALGNSAGKTTQGLNCVAIGSSAGGVTQSESAVAVGASAGYQRQGTHATAFGDKAGYTDQGSSSVAVGRDAGKTDQGDNAVACGYLAGSDTQGPNGIALGNRAGNFTQGTGSVATGYAAGRNFQGDYAVALGYEAGLGASGDPAQGQGDNAVAIGYAAGGTGQGDDSIAIGNRAGQTNQGANGIIISSGGVAINRTTANHIMLYSGSGKYMEYNGTNSWTFNGGGVTVPNDNLLVGRTSLSAAVTDHGWQVTANGNVYQYSSVTGTSDAHRWYNGNGTLIATINGNGAGYFLGGATYSGPLKADEIIQDGAPVVDSLQIIRAFMKLRAATADPDSTVEELREKLKTAVDDIIDQFQDQIDNMPTPLED